MDDGVGTGTRVVDSLSARLEAQARGGCLDVWIRCVGSGCSGRCRNVSPSCTEEGVEGGGHDSTLRHRSLFTGVVKVCFLS
ncbi:hypothetical protein BT69DRAFT_1278329 [Atractiella rhizophila]|nr:hypothetical protein BT69DRAFT_1278329 [Atractiella rhizophila]